MSTADSASPASDPNPAHEPVLSQPAPAVSLHRRLEILRYIDAFTGLPDAVLEDLAALLGEEDFAAGTIVVREGDIGDRLYLIVQGHADVSARTLAGQVMLTHLEDGDLFGELALLYPHQRRQATVTAITPLRTLTLTIEAFQDLLRSYPEVRKIFEAAAKRKLLAKFMQVNVLYRLHFRNPRRERLFLASVSFFLTFGAVRSITLAIRAGRGPFRDIRAGNRHIHHLVWGILLLLMVGYAWLVQIGTGTGDPRRWNRETALVYGIGSALTLDEFALWLNLADVYWEPEGRRSIDAVIFFGSLLSLGFWGGPFFGGLLRFLFRRSRHTPRPVE